MSVLLLAMIAVTALLAFARASESEAERDRRTREALAIAKEALIGFAASVVLTPIGEARPGDLPCPDTNNDGSAELSCSTAAERLGRLPWKTLGLPDLRDGDGERLWYAVSDNFKNNPRTPCPSHSDARCLNSNTLGTITVRDATGSIVHDATNTNPITHNGIVAVVIAPGAVLKREDSAGPSQARDAGGINIRQNYLDVLVLPPPTGEDNADFLDGSTNGFVAGPVLNASGKVIVNDRILTISLQDILPVLERRVEREVALCLKEYAVGSGQKYPWAADMIQTAFGNYSDASARRYGRIPDPPFTKTTTDDGAMSSTWVGPCKLPQAPVVPPDTTWWLNWKSQVLYSIALDFQPGSAAACGSCLTVNRPTGGAVPNVRAVVMVAGRALTGQNRIAGTVHADPVYYVELQNFTNPNAPDSTFEIRAIDTTFNDRLGHLP